MNYTKFVIIGDGRTGSVLLQTLLDSHTNTLAFGEIFNLDEGVRINGAIIERPIAQEEDPIAYLQNHIYKEYLSSVKAVGFRLFYDHARNDAWKSVWEYSKNTNVRIIHLKRRNLLDRYLSLQLSIRLNKWIVFQGGDNILYEPITIDPNDCLKDFHHTAFLQEKTDSFFKDNPKLEVIYEDLCNDMAGECNRIQAFLGLESQELFTQTSKQRTQKKTEVIENYNQLKTNLEYWISQGRAKKEWMNFFND